MIRPSVRLTTIRGIEVGVHYSWVIIFFLITLSLATYFAEQHPHWSRAEHYVIGVLTSLLFFASILLHELAHSFVALAKQLPVRSITLFVFGGVAQIGREPDRPSTEFLIAIAGPVASLLLAVGFGLIHMLAGASFEHVAALADWLASINFMLAIFNLLPGFPLDGGRIFRAAVWQITGNATKAARIAARSGQLFAYAFMIGGIVLAFTVNWFSGLWIVFIGWFLHNAAQESLVQVSVRSALSGIVAQDIMTQDCPQVPGKISLADLVENHILRTGQRCFLVTEGGRLDGLVTLHQIKAVPSERWPTTSVHEAMTPLSHLSAVSPDTPIFEVLQVLESKDINQVPVVKTGRFLGMITREHLLRMIFTKMELEAATA